MRTVVIAGMSLAGLRAAETLRREGFGGRVVAISPESHLPYDRPPLSKDLLAGECEPEDCLLRRQGVDDLELDWRHERSAAALDVDAREVKLDDGERVAFDGLVIATGAEARRLPGVAGGHRDGRGLAGVFTLRTLDDALAIREVLTGRPEVVVIGAGFIGCEVAATCRTRGLHVTVVDVLAQPVIRGVGAVVGEVVAAMHRDHGVDLRLGTGVEAVEGDDDGVVRGVRLADGTLLDAGVVVVGVGAVPVTGWLEGSGLTIADGVVCDETCLAAPGVVAAGDVARWPNPLFDGESMRLEHWSNATEQGVAAALRLLAGDLPGDAFAPVPYVWSDQFGSRIQVVGRVDPHDDMRVVHGTLEERRFVALFGRSGRLVGALGFDRPRQVMQYRGLILDRTGLDDAIAVTGAG